MYLVYLNKTKHLTDYCYPQLIVSFAYKDHGLLLQHKYGLQYTIHKAMSIFVDEGQQLKQNNVSNQQQQQYYCNLSIGLI